MRASYIGIKDSRQLDLWPELKNKGMLQLAHLTFNPMQSAERPQLREDAKRAASVGQAASETAPLGILAITASPCRKGNSYE